MADSTSWEADLEAVLNESTDTEAIDAEEPTSLDTDNTPLDETQEPVADLTVDDTSTPAEESVAEQVEPVAATAEPEPPKPNWDSPENPHYAKARELDDTKAKAKALFDQLAQKRATELQHQRIQALSDDDPARAVEIQQLVADAQRPVLERAQQLEGEVEFAAKLATVVEAAVAHVLTPDEHQKVLAEVERMMALPGGPEYLQHDLQSRKAERDRVSAERAADKQRIAELERRLAAQATLDERRKSGADMVDSNTGTGKGFQARYDAASGEEALDVLLESLQIS